MQAVAQAIDVRKRFGNTVALDGANMEIVAGEIHGLVGRNGAGKSTLVSMFSGLLAPDSGEVRRDDVACVYQHSKLVPHLSVAENIFLNRYAGPGLISWKRMGDDARALLQEWAIDVDPGALAASLSVEKKQLVEIARALSMGTRFLILDEPTARLDGRAIARLFDRLRHLRDAGVAVLFISHHLQEVYELCDRVTVLRDGKSVRSQAVRDLPQSQLVAAMSAQPSTREAPTTRTLGEVRLRVDGAGVQFSVRAGEIYGLAGAGGSGKVAVALAIAGFRSMRGRTISVDGVALEHRSVRAALDAGIGFVPRDRHREGFVGQMSLAENATMTATKELGRFGFIAPSRLRARGNDAIHRFDIAAAPNAAVQTLSGGNQQKVVLARALASGPRVLVMIEPTAGVDVVSKAALQAEIDRARENGTAIVIASDDVDDLRLCDRVGVMRGKALVAEYDRGWEEATLVAEMEGLAKGA